MNDMSRDFQRVDPNLIDEYTALGTATVYEANDQKGAMDHSIRPISWGQRACGSAVTVQCHPGDNLTLHAALALAQPGDVIVADVGQFLDAGYWGEVMTVAAIARGIAGMVINGGIRDRDAIVRRDFPIWSCAICMRGTTKYSLGRINCPIVIGGIIVQAGDLVLGDDDGVIAVKQNDLANVLAKSREREAHETRLMEQLESGVLTVDLLGLQKTLEEQNLRL